MAAIAETGPDALLEPHVAEYKVDISVLGGVLETRLERTETGYRATHVVRATGLSRLLAGGSISDTSEFEVVDDTLRPRRFATEDTASRDRTQADIRFDWSANTAAGSVNGEPFELELAEPMHDRISIQYKLMHDLLEGRADSSYVLFEPDELKDLDVRIVGEREVEVPAGRFRVLGVQQQATESRRITTLWCAPELGYLPVVIEQHRKGKLRMRATLKDYRPLDG
ncbi:MAG: DUF3108 domain-containing protein [Woeseiaceae bacterium]|nr:DUF3108 domain-containing protein [Woeseiaceae bacterium]